MRLRVLWPAQLISMPAEALSTKMSGASEEFHESREARHDGTIARWRSLEAHEL